MRAVRRPHVRRPQPPAPLQPLGRLPSAPRMWREYFLTGDVGVTVGNTTYTFVTGTPAVNQVQYSTSITLANLAKNLEAAINGVFHPVRYDELYQRQPDRQLSRHGNRVVRHRNGHRKERRSRGQLQRDHRR